MRDWSPNSLSNGISAPPLNLRGLQGDSLLSHHRLQGNLCSGAPPPSPSSLTSRSAGLFLSHPTPLSAAAPFCLAVFPLLPYVLTEALPPSLSGSALPRGGSDLEPGKLLAASHRGHPCSPSPATQPPAIQTQHTAEPNETRKSKPLVTVAVFPPAMLSLPGLQRASLHGLVAVVLWVVASQVLKTCRLRDATTSLGNPLQCFVILTGILLFLPYLQPEPLYFQQMPRSLTLPPGSAGKSLSPSP